MENKLYTIIMPFTGTAVRQVEATSEEEAIERFYKEADLSDIEQWEFCKTIVEGNVFHGIQNSIEVICED